MNRIFINRFLQWFGLFLLITSSFYFRFTNLPTNPGWYNDEGTYINMAMNLQEGRSEYLGIEGSMLIIGRMPLFTSLLSLVFDIFGPGLEPIRYLTAGAGVLSVGLLYFVLLRILGPAQPYLPFLAAFILAIHPRAVLFSRVGFGYNLLTPLVILSFWGLWNYVNKPQKGWLFLAVTLTGIGLITELAFIAYSILVIGVILVRRRQDALWAVPLLYLPFGMHCLMSYLQYGEIFTSDFWMTFFRSTNPDIPFQLVSIFFNLTHLFYYNPVFLLGFFGLLIIRPLKLSLLTIAAYLIPFMIIAQNFPLLMQGYYYISPFFPFIAIGMAYAIMKGLEILIHFAQQVYELSTRYIQHPWITKYIKILTTDSLIFILFLFPLSYALYSLNNQVHHQFISGFDPIFLDAKDSQKVVHFINQRVAPDDLVIASPALAWAIVANATDYQISIAAMPTSTIHFPAGIPQDRLAFDVDYRKAKFIVVDTILLSWPTAGIPGLTELLAFAQAGELAYQSGDISVYYNPLAR